MTLEDRLQGEWMCCVDDQCLEDAWTISIRGRECDFEGTTGALVFAGEEASLDLGGGDHFVINREWLLEGPDARHRTGEIPVTFEGRHGTLQTGWMFRPGQTI